MQRNDIMLTYYDRIVVVEIKSFQMKSNGWMDLRRNDNIAQKQTVPQLFTKTIAVVGIGIMTEATWQK